MKTNGKKIPGYLPALLCIIFFSLASYFLISFFPPAEEAEDTWADSGFSAFGVYESTAVCLELTCQENFDQDLRPILLSFLDNCSYSSD